MCRKDNGDNILLFWKNENKDHVVLLNSTQVFSDMYNKFSFLAFLQLEMTPLQKRKKKGQIIQQPKNA